VQLSLPEPRYQRLSRITRCGGSSGHKDGVAQALDLEGDPRDAPVELLELARLLLGGEARPVLEVLEGRLARVAGELHEGALGVQALGQLARGKPAEQGGRLWARLFARFSQLLSRRQGAKGVPLDGIDEQDLLEEMRHGRRVVDGEEQGVAPGAPPPAAPGRPRPPPASPSGAVAGYGLLEVVVEAVGVVVAVGGRLLAGRRRRARPLGPAPPRLEQGAQPAGVVAGAGAWAVAATGSRAVGLIVQAGTGGVGTKLLTGLIQAGRVAAEIPLCLVAAATAGFTAGGLSEEAATVGTVPGGSMRKPRSAAVPRPQKGLLDTVLTLVVNAAVEVEPRCRQSGYR
jgi:hypothetical protein